MDSLRSVTILVVDDDEGHRALIRRNLRRAGLANPVVDLPNGEEALNYVFRHGPHVERRSDDELIMLLDINMPGLDGIEVLRQIKADPVKKKIPVIIVTTTDDPREVNRCYELNCNAYVTKPVDPIEFIDVVKRLGMFLSIVRAPEES